MEITVKDVSARLAQRAGAIAPMLLPWGRDVKGEWWAGDLANKPGDSLKVKLNGEHAGHWKDWAEQSHKGDLLDLWAAVKGIPLPDAIREAKAYLGISDGMSAQGERRYSSPPDSVKKGIQALTPEAVAMEFLCKVRKLEPAIVNRFRMSSDAKGNLVFPCCSPSGKLINRSYRSLGEKKRVWQDEGCAPCLFGWHALSEDAFRNRTVLICEGQIDAATWTQLGVPALSVPSGSGLTWIEYEWENLAAFETIYLSFDMDAAGKDILQKVTVRLGAERCKIVHLPHKDANDCLKQGATADDASRWIASATLPAVKNLVTANDLRDRLMQALAPRPEYFTIPFFRLPGRDQGFYPRPAELTLWTGSTSEGKSTFLNFLMMTLMLAGIPVFIASMEAKAETVLRKMMATFFGKYPSQVDVDEFLREVGHLLIIADVVGFIGREELLEMLRFSQRRYGVQHCFIDSLMKIDGLEEDYPEQGKFMNNLQEVAKQTDLHIHLVAHPRKLGKGEKPGKMDVKGSSLLPNNADNIVAVCRNWDKDQLRKDGQLTPQAAAEMYDTEIRVEKQRETGWEGNFLLTLDSQTGIYSAAKRRN